VPGEGTPVRFGNLPGDPVEVGEKIPGNHSRMVDVSEVAHRVRSPRDVQAMS